MPADCTIVTATLPERGDLLAQAVRSVAAQDVLPAAHHIAVDYQRQGSALTLAPILEGVQTTWFCRLDDDDFLLPGHVSALMRATRLMGTDRQGRAGPPDVIYTYCKAVNGKVPKGVNRPFDADLLAKRNFIPCTALVRTAAARSVGFQPTGTYWAEDYGMWLRLLEAGARFLSVPTVTWVYRRSHNHWQKSKNRPADSRAQLDAAL